MHPKKVDKSRTTELSPKIVGTARNSFGTRLCQRIECSRCHKTDYVSVRIANSKTKYCRGCAERFLSTYETGRFVAEKQVKCRCSQCHQEFEVNSSVASKKEELMCKDCFRGFEVWRGSRLYAPDNQEPKRLIVKSGSKTIIRKIIHDAV